MVKNQHGHNIHHQQQQHHPHHHNQQQHQQQPHHQSHQHQAHAAAAANAAANHPQQPPLPPPPSAQQHPHHPQHQQQHHHQPNLAQQQHHHHPHHHYMPHHSQQHHSHNLSQHHGAPHHHQQQQHHNQHHQQQQMHVTPLNSNNMPQQQMPPQQQQQQHHTNPELRQSMNQAPVAPHSANRLAHSEMLPDQQQQPHPSQSQQPQQSTQPAPHPQLMQQNTTSQPPPPSMQRVPSHTIQQQQQPQAPPQQSQQPVQPPVANQQLAAAPQHSINPHHPYHPSHLANAQQIQHPNHAPPHHPGHHPAHNQHPSQHQHMHHMSPSVPQQWLGSPHQPSPPVMPVARQPTPQGPLAHQAPSQQSPQPQQPQLANARQPNPMQHAHMIHSQRHPYMYDPENRQPRMYMPTNNPMAPSGSVPPQQQQFDHTQSTASHPQEGNIAPQQQLPNMSHPSNLPMTSPVMNTSVANSNVHHLPNGPMMDAQMSNRMPMNVHYMHPNMYGMHIPMHYPQFSPLPPNPAMLQPRMPANLGQYPNDVMPYGTPVQMRMSHPLPSSAPPSTRTVVSGSYTQPNSVAPTTPTTQITPRQKKMAIIADPSTRRVIPITELQDVEVSSQTHKDSDKVSSTTTAPSSTAEISSTNEIDPKPSVNSTTEKEPVIEESQQSNLAIDKDKETSVAKKLDVDEESKKVPIISSEKTTPTHDLKTINTTKQQSPTTQIDIERDISDQLQSLSVSSDNKNHVDSLSSGDNKVDVSGPSTKPPSEASREVSRDPSSERKDDNVVTTPTHPTPPNESKQPDPVVKKSELPYVTGQFSPSNPSGQKKYSIDFMWAVCRQLKLDMKIGFEPQHMQNDFLPNYVSQNNFHAQRPWQSQSQQFSQPKKKIIQAPPRIEVELKTVENPWVPELESEKPANVEGELDTKRLLKVFRGHLNKLTPQKYDDLIKKIKALDLRDRERLNSVINLVFDKAVDEPGFCSLYAQVCKVISEDNTDFNFLLVKKCQEEFETADLYDGLNVEERKIDIEKEKESNKRKLLLEELYEDMRLRRKKYLGTIKLIGEMYKLNLLLPKIIGLCMSHLIHEANNENLECLCSLIATVGDKMARETDKDIRSAFTNTLDILKGFANNKKTDEAFELESRVKFKILDTIDLSKRNWRPRMVENNPKKLGEYKEEDMRQQQLQQNHANQSRGIQRMDDRDRNRRGMGMRDGRK